MPSKEIIKKMKEKLLEELKSFSSQDENGSSELPKSNDSEPVILSQSSGVHFSDYELDDDRAEKSAQSSSNYNINTGDISKEPYIKKEGDKKILVLPDKIQD